MTLSKAIKILTLDWGRNFKGDAKELVKAQELGIEALRRVKDMRISPCTTADEILPSETGE